MEDIYHEIEGKISNRIKALREKLGVSQEEFGGKFGITQQYVGALEKGIRRPSVSLVFMIAKVLKVSNQWLATGKGKGPKL